MQENVENDSKRETQNSFLKETTFNSDIGIEIRKEIEKKYKNSKSNHYYVFPRREPEGFTSRRNLTREKHSIGANKLNKYSLNNEIYKIYSREAVSLKRINNYFEETKSRKMPSTSKKHLRNQSSPYRSRSPIQKPREFSAYLQISLNKKKKKFQLGEINTSQLPAIGNNKLTSHAALKSLIQNTRKKILRQNPLEKF
ncbi:hypothetical protein SteCoe_6419 [Stentor coeruleus]|uniref:Uncharacterized protein n=1 Tax=Stentor coeruleus TaxID=5963 RepID=A0A1R2CQ01_9CILI|nr:hypothetical protein SteCoe_6419 [Stentor coeruleus]